MVRGKRQQTYAEMVDVLERLPQLLADTRRARQLSLREAAAEIGIGFTTVRRIESGEGEPSGHNLLQVIRWLDRGQQPELPIR